MDELDGSREQTDGDDGIGDSDDIDDEDSEGGRREGTAPPAAAEDPVAPDVVQAVVDFLDDLIDDPELADDPGHPGCRRRAPEP